MRPIVQAKSAAARRATTATAARWVLLLIGALAGGGFFAIRATAEPSQLHAAFDDVHRTLAGKGEPVSGEIRIASGQTPAVKQAAQEVLPSVQKPAAPATSVSQSPKRRSPQTSEMSSPPAEALPPPMTATVPLIGSEPVDGLQLKKNEKNGLITLIVRDKSLSQVLALIAQTQNLNIVASNDIDALISITLRDVPIEEALTAILSVANYTWVKRNNIILITSLTDATNLPADVQGRQIQVFDLDFASATVVAESVTNFLSPVGKVSVGVSNPANNRLTQERVVVEDLPESLCRIGAYIAQIDQAPRQVLIEAHVLQVELDDTNRCGVNFNALFRIAGANANILSVPSVAVPLPKPGVPVTPPTAPALLATLTSHDLNAVIEMLQTTSDTKTLGSPKLLVLNEQEARLQVGEHLGFKVTTTTETSTLESVQFLDVGVVLRLTPRITRDGRVLLHVKPEVSKGAVNPETGLPESQTAELETDIMLNDNEGMVIGGLIKEDDIVSQSKVPYLGNVKGVGFLFRRSEVTKKRAEIIVALVPRIQPYCQQYHNFEEGELVKASVPLYHGALCRTDRPWDPVLPDGKRVSYPLIPQKYRPMGYFHDLGPQYVIPPYPLPTQEFSDEPCETMGPTPAAPAPQGPVFEDDELPLPSAGDELHGNEIISDQQ